MASSAQDRLGGEDRRAVARKGMLGRRSEWAERMHTPVRLVSGTDGTGTADRWQHRR